MARFKISMKLQGLDLQIEGAREDIPVITHNLGAQLSGLLGPAGAIVEGNVLDRKVAQSLPPIEINGGDVARRKGKRRKVSSAAGGETGNGVVTPVDVKIDPAKYGAPTQDWSTADKAMWMLYVVAEETGRPSLTNTEVAATFNKHFRQAGEIRRQNVWRDLGKQKTKQTIGEDTTKEPPEWYLHDSGKRIVQELIKKTKAT